MKVSELIEKLREMPQDAEVVGENHEWGCHYRMTELRSVGTVYTESRYEMKTDEDRKKNEIPNAVEIS